MRWLLSVVCLVLLGAVLLADAQTTVYAPGSANAPEQFQIVKSVGEDSLDTSAPTGSQSEIWVNWTYPVNQGNAAPSDYGVDVVSTSGTVKQTCTSVTTSAGCYGLILRYFDQNIQEGTQYTIAAYATNAYGEGVRTSSQVVTVPWAGTPRQPTALATNYVAATSFVLSFTPPTKLGQTGSTGSAVDITKVVLQTPFFQVQLKTGSGVWTPVTFYDETAGTAAAPFNASPFATQSCVVSGTGATASSSILTASTAYTLRVRAVGQWGFGVWSTTASQTTLDGKASPNAVAQPTVVAAASNGGLIRWTSPQLTGGAITSFKVETASSANGGTALYTAFSTPTGSAVVDSQFGRVTGGHALISGLSSTNISAYVVRVQATNGNGDGTVQVGTAGWQTITLSAANAAPVIGAPTLVACWTVTGTTVINCVFNTTAATTIGGGGFGATPYTFGANGVAGAAGTVSMAAADLTGSVSFNATAAGTVNLVVTNVSTQTVSSGMTFVTSVGVTAPLAAVWYNRSGTAVTDVNGYITLGTNFLVMYPGSPQNRGVVATAAAATGALGGMNAVGFQTGTNAGNNGAANTNFAFLDGTTAASSLTASKFVVAIQVTAGNTVTAGVAYTLISGGTIAPMFCCTANATSSNAAAAGAVTAVTATGAFAGANATASAPNAITIIDVTDTAMTFVITLTGTGNQYAALSGTAPAGAQTASNFLVTATGAVTVRGAAVASGLTTTCNANQPASGHLDGYQCTLSGLLPGRVYTPTVTYTYPNSGGTAPVSAAAAPTSGGTTYWTASTRPDIYTAAANAIYYVASTSATVWLQLPLTNVGQGSLNTISAVGAGNQQFKDITTTITVQQTSNTASNATYRAFLIGDAGPTTVTGASTPSAGNWRAVTLSALGNNGTTGGNTYTVNVSTENQINRSSSAWTGTLTTSGTPATAIVSPTAPTISTTVRYITNSAFWLEWEAPAGNVGVLNTPAWYVVSTCDGNTGTNPTPADVTDLGVAGTTSAVTRNRVLAKISGISGTSCVVKVAFNNGSGAAGTLGANLNFSSTVTVTLSTSTTVPAVATSPVFDHINSTSFVVAFTLPNIWGGGGDANSGFTYAYTVTSGSNTDQAAILGTTAGGAGNGSVATTFYGLFSINTGFYQQITGFNLVSGGVTTATNLVANSAYSVKAKVTNNALTSAASAAGSTTTDRNGDVPLAPTNVAITRLFSTGLRLTFSTPVSVGGDNTATSNATQGNVTTPNPSLAPFRVIYTSTSASSATAATAGSAVSLDTSASPSVNGGSGVAGWNNNLTSYYIDITALTAATAYSIQICANNQFSIAFPTSPFNPAGTTALPVTCVFSTAVAITTPAASGVLPTVPSAITLTQYGLTNISFSWNIAQSFGSNSVTTFTIFRGTASATPTSLTTVALPTVGNTASYADTGLTANTSYTYNVYATSSTGNSATSVNLTQTTHNTNDTPIAPSAPTLAGGVANSQGAGSGTNGSFAGNFYQDVTTNISWASPVGIGGSSINGYIVTANTNNCNRTYTWTTTTTNYSFTTVPGKSYTYAVQATNTRSDSGVTSTQSGAQSATLSQIANAIVRPYPLPALTTGGTAGSTGSGYVTFTLSTPSTVQGTQASLLTSDGALAYVGVQVLVQNLTNVTSTTFVPDMFVTQFTGGLGGTTSSLLVNGLTANTKYRFSVASFNGYQTAWSTSVLTITTNASAVRPGGVTSLASNLLLKRSTSVWVTWGQPQETGGQGFVSQWQVSWKAATASTTSTNLTQIQSAVIRGLTDATTYFVDVRGINGVGTSTTQGTFTGGILNNGLDNNVLTGQVPNDQTNFAVTSNTGTAIAFSWTTATGASTAITGQTLSAQNGITATTPSATLGATDTTASVTVVNGNFYRFFLNASNSIGQGNNSLSIYIQANPITTTGVTAAAGTPSLDFYSANEYRVSWAAVGSSTTSATVYYLVYWQWTTRFLASTGNPAAADGLGLNTAVVGNSPSSNPLTAGTCTQLVYTIKPASRYRMVLIGNNATGLGQGSQGTASNNVGSPTQGALTQTGQAASPAAPTQGATANNSITVNFSTPTYTGLALITSYEIQTFPENGGKVVLGYKNASDTTSSSRANYTYTQANLQPGTPYVVNVRAINSFGQSIPSANLRISTTGGSGFAASTSLWTVVLMAIAALLAFAF